MSLVITLKDIEFTNPNLPIIPMDYPTNGLDTLYRMDNIVNGVLQDSSGNGRHGTLDNIYTLTNEGVRLDDGFVQTPCTINDDDITIFCVHRIDAIPSEGTPDSRFRFPWSFYKGGDTSEQDQVYYTPSTQEFGSLKSSSGRVDWVSAQEKWIFTCVSWGSGRYKYFCPQFDKTSDVAITPKPTLVDGVTLNIGNIGTAKAGVSLKYGAFNGTVGVWGFYKKTKSMAEIHEIYKAAQIQMAKRGIVI